MIDQGLFIVVLLVIMVISSGRCKGTSWRASDRLDDRIDLLEAALRRLLRSKGVD